MRISADVHRFHEFAAVAFCGCDGQTVYLTAADAARLADALRACVDDIAARTFTASTFRTVNIPLENNGSRY